MIRGAGGLLLTALLLALTACASRGADGAGGQEPKVLTVFAAASLAEVFQELGRTFEAAHPGVSVRFNFAGSQQLLAQLDHGARADVFASASQQEMEAAINASLVVSGTQRTFARNRLIVIYPRENPGALRELADLGRPGLKIAIADASVPVGRYTLALLEAMSDDPAFSRDIAERVLNSVVSREENVQAVVSKVRLGEVDAGIVYSSDVGGKAADELATITIPKHLNPIASYPIAPLADAAQPDLARQFIELVLSQQGQEVLRAYGFIPSQTGRP